MDWDGEPETLATKGWRRGERLVAGLGGGVAVAAAIAYAQEPCVAQCASDAYALGLLPLVGAVVGGVLERRAARQGLVPYLRPVPEPPPRLLTPTLEQVLTVEQSKTL